MFRGGAERFTINIEAEELKRQPAGCPQPYFDCLYVFFLLSFFSNCCCSLPLYSSLAWNCEAILRQEAVCEITHFIELNN